MNYPVVDFRKPVRVPEDIGQMLSRWQANSRESIEVRLSRLLEGELKVSLVSPEPVTGGELREELDSALVYRIDVGPQSEPTLLVLDRQLSLSMIWGMLGAPQEKLPEDRSLTTIERTSLDFLVQEIRRSMEKCQPLTAHQSLKFVGPIDFNELHTEFPVNRTNADVGFKINLPHGEGRIRWILPQNLTLNMVAFFPSSIQSDGQAAEALKRLVLSTAADLSVRIGMCEMQLTKLKSLAPGDLIVLNQRIDEPLTADLRGQQMFLGWCGRSGKHQVFQIDEIVDPSSLSHEHEARGGY